MRNGSAVRSAALVFLAPTLFSFARADNAPSTRAVIRGSGNDVTIVYQAPVRPRASVWPNALAAPAAPAADPTSGAVDEALRMKSSGASDQAVVAFLRKNQADVPDVVDADVIRDFRRAGAGDAVVALVSRYSAIDIGVTAEDSVPLPPQFYEQQAADAGGFPDLANLGYPFYGSGGYGYASGGWWGGRGGRFPHVMPHKAVLFRSGRPVLAKPQPMPAHLSGGATLAHGTGGGHRTR
ncbi:MAG TPA: hypothetical protein VMN82_04600 [Thermoanaerobaculia bacterium]|nr:hypothetical protein [Thermoanaerobaculia bacterium]